MAIKERLHRLADQWPPEPATRAAQLEALAEVLHLLGRLVESPDLVANAGESGLGHAEAQLPSVHALARDVWGTALVGWETQIEKCADLDGEHWVATGTVDVNREMFRNSMRDFFGRMSAEFEGRDLSRLVVDFRRRR